MSLYLGLLSSAAIVAQKLEEFGEFGYCGEVGELGKVEKVGKVGELEVVAAMAAMAVAWWSSVLGRWMWNGNGRHRILRGLLQPSGRNGPACRLF